MGIANGMTAEAMLAIANGSIVGGSVNANGDLLLINRAGASVYAGHVAGTAGLKGDTGLTGPPSATIIAAVPVTNTPDTYPTGITMFNKPSGTVPNGVWPADLVSVVTVRISAARTVQTVYEKATGRTWTRVEDATVGWSAFQEMAMVANVAPLAHTHSAADIISGILASTVLEPKVFLGRGAITSVIDWNTLTTAGTYDVATIGTNSPSVSTGTTNGLLEVKSSDNTGQIVQQFTANNGLREVYFRSRYNGTWTVWSELHNWFDTQVDIPNHFSDSGVTAGNSAWLPSRLRQTVQRIDNTDIKALKTTGFYAGVTVTNAVDTNYWYYEVIANDPGYVTYIAQEFYGDRVFRAYFQGGNWNGWQQINQSDSGWVDISSGISWGTGWSYVADSKAPGMKVRKIGNQTQALFGNVQLAANTLTSTAVPADGNLSNIKVFSGIPATYRPSAGTMGSLTLGSAGPMVSCFVDDTGQVTMSAVNPGFRYDINNLIGLIGSWYN